MGSVGVEPTPADFQSAASTELAYFPYCDTVIQVSQCLSRIFMPIPRVSFTELMSVSLGMFEV